MAKVWFQIFVVVPANQMPKTMISSILSLNSYGDALSGITPAHRPVSQSLYTILARCYYVSRSYQQSMKRAGSSLRTRRCLMALPAPCLHCWRHRQHNEKLWCLRTSMQRVTATRWEIAFSESVLRYMEDSQLQDKHVLMARGLRHLHIKTGEHIVRTTYNAAQCEDACSLFSMKHSQNVWFSRAPMTWDSRSWNARMIAPPHTNIYLYYCYGPGSESLQMEGGHQPLLLKWGRVRPWCWWLKSLPVWLIKCEQACSCGCTR